MLCEKTEMRRFDGLLSKRTKYLIQFTLPVNYFPSHSQDILIEQYATLTD